MFFNTAIAFKGFALKSALTCLKIIWFHLADLCVCLSGCRCVRGSAQRCRGAPPVSSRAAPSLPLTECWRTGEWEEEGERLPQTLKLATATFPSVHFPPPPLLLPLPPPLPPHLLTAAVGWVFMLICPTVQTHPPAACIILTTVRREVLTLLITQVSTTCLPPFFLRSEFIKELNWHCTINTLTAEPQHPNGC